MTKFKEGDIVVHVTGKRKMIITDVYPHEDDIIKAIYDCRWEAKEDFGHGTFLENELKKWTKRNISCKYCGGKLSDSRAFCDECGRDQDE